MSQHITLALLLDPDAMARIDLFRQQCGAEHVTPSDLDTHLTVLSVRLDPDAATEQTLMELLADHEDQHGSTEMSGKFTELAVGGDGAMHARIAPQFLIDFQAAALDLLDPSIVRANTHELPAGMFTDTERENLLEFGYPFVGEDIQAWLPLGRMPGTHHGVDGEDLAAMFASHMELDPIGFDRVAFLLIAEDGTGLEILAEMNL